MSGIKSALRNGPPMALEFILRLLIGGLAVLRVGDQISAGSRLLGRDLAFETCRGRDGLVLPDITVIDVVGVVGVVIRNAVPP